MTCTYRVIPNIVRIGLLATLYAISPFNLLGQTDSIPTDTTDTIFENTGPKSFKTENLTENRKMPPQAAAHLKKGDKYFAFGPEKYDKGLKEYLAAQKYNPDNAKINLKIGLCYLNIKQDKIKAINYLEKAHNQNKRVDPKINLYLGKAYHLSQNLEAAIDEYNEYISIYSKKHRYFTPEELDSALADVMKSIEECKIGIELTQKPIRAFIYNLGNNINSTYPDYDPYIAYYDSAIYFTSRRQTTRGGGRADIDAEYYEDIYVAKRIKGEWMEAKSIGNKINKKTNNAIIGLTFDALKMFVYKDIERGNIYLSEYKNGRWSKPKNIKGINTPHRETSACFSYDEKAIFFVSNRPGGYGGNDIYITYLKENGKWSKPINAGSTLNTIYDEGRVFLHRDGKTLYFSSKGHKSMGGYDIFSTEMNEDSSWSKPKNIGYPISTVDDDISFAMSMFKDVAYYSALKPTGHGNKDIYQVLFLDYIKPTFMFTYEAPQPELMLHDKKIEEPEPIPSLTAFEIEKESDDYSLIEDLANLQLLNELPDGDTIDISSRISNKELKIDQLKEVLSNKSLSLKDSVKYGAELVEAENRLVEMTKAKDDSITLAEETARYQDSLRIANLSTNVSADTEIESTENEILETAKPESDTAIQEVTELTESDTEQVSLVEPDTSISEEMAMVN